MSHRKRSGQRRRGGFTLLEVLIVVGIIAILAAFVVPNLMGTREGAEIDMTIAAIGPSGPIGQAIDLFRTHMGRYPDELSELTEKPDDDDEDKWRGPYITNPENMKDPWGNEYQYRYPGEVHEDRYDLWSMGPDREDGTEDDIKNWSEG